MNKKKYQAQKKLNEELDKINKYLNNMMVRHGLLKDYRENIEEETDGEIQGPQEMDRRLPEDSE